MNFLTPQNGSLVLFLIVLLVLLAVLHVALAMRHDHEVALKGPKIELDEILKRIERAKEELNDIEEQLRQRRESFDNVAELEAHADALRRQIMDLEAEWAQMDERREEIRKLQEETNDAIDEKLTADRDLAEVTAELETHRLEAERAASLVSQISELERQEERLGARVDELQDQAAALAEAEARVGTLAEKAEGLQRDVARLSGETTAAENRLEELKAEREVLQKAIAELRLEHAEEAVKTAASGQAGNAAASTSDDPLAELNARPEVLQQLSRWSSWNPADEAEAIKTVTDRFKAVGLTYSKRVIRAFHTAMKVNETSQMAVLAGISGTGKSQLPRHYAAGMGIGFLQVPVQPRWDSPQDLMGFYNYIEGRYRPTDMARALYHLDQFNGPKGQDDLQDRMMLILLDEMNLARVEYYFSDFLSRLESRPGRGQSSNVQLRKDAEIELEIPMPNGKSSPRIFPGYNLLFAGTMNEDESTQALSDKVVDRANVLRFTAPRRIEVGAKKASLAEPQALSRSKWERWIRSPHDLRDADRTNAHVERLVDIMGGLQRPFGHRLGIAMMDYVANYPELDGGYDPKVPMADQVEMRLLPKLRGIDVEAMREHLDRLEGFVEQELQDHDLAQAIRHSVEVAESGSGSFHWHGVTRT